MFNLWISLKISILFCILFLFYLLKYLPTIGSFVALSYMKGKNDLNSKNKPHIYNAKPIIVYLNISIVKNPKKNTMLPFIFPNF